MNRRTVHEYPRHIQDQISAQLHRIPTGLCYPQPEQDVGMLPLGANQDEKGSKGRFRVRITRVGAKLLDADNCAGSVKFILDALRYSRCISDDSPQAITLEVFQRTAPKGERGTLIEVERLP